MWPASSVPTEYHEVINCFIDITLIIEHVKELVHDRDLGEVVLPNVAEWVLLEKVFILIQLGDVIASEAVFMESY